MSHMLLELIVWSLVAFAIGCVLGCFFRKFFGAAEIPVAIPAVAATAAVAARAALPVAPRVETPAYVPLTRPQPIAEPVISAPIPAVPAMAPVAAAALAKPRGLAGARGGKADDLLRISGVGPKNEAILHSLGVFHFDQIAGWTKSEVDWVDDHLKFNGRITRENWIDQARLLAGGKEAEFLSLYGTGGERNAAGKVVPKAAEPEAMALSSSAGSGKAERPKGIAKARGGKADNLQRISGVGPKNERVLHSLGFFHFDQIAEWTGEQVAWVDEHLKFGGRIKREEWKRQARLLADGREDEFTRLYGTGGLRSKGGATKPGERTRKR